MIKKATTIMVCTFGFLGVFTAVFFYMQPNDFGVMMQNSVPVLYDFLLYYFIASGALSFFVVGIGGAICVLKKRSFRKEGFGIILNIISLTCYIFFGILT